VDLSQGESPLLGAARPGSGSIQQFAEGLFADLLLGDTQRRPVVLQNHALP
jgi:hypothetical protein